MQYQDAIDFLFPLHRFGIRPGLERMRSLLPSLGSPERRLGRVVHLAGTNGKGTVASALASIFTAAGMKTGLYTSPHLVDFTERIRVDGRQIPREMVAASCSAMQQAVLETGATFFEATTAMAFDFFAREGVEVSVIETGMGGRLDATNVVVPELVVIPTISLDHTAWLGDTLAQIAAEKAAIIKPGSAVFTGATGEALDVIADAAERCGAPLFVAGRDATFELLDLQPGSLELAVTLANGERQRLVAPLTGAFHATNVVLAVLAARYAGIGWAEISTGLSRLPLSGYHARLERVSTDPQVLLDVSHNPDGMARSVQALRDIRASFRDLYVLVGVAADKDAAAMVRPLAGIARTMVTVPIPSERSLEPARLARFCTDAGATDVRSCTTSAEGFDLLCSLAGREDMILVTGSFFLAGELLAGRRFTGRAGVH